MKEKILKDYKQFGSTYVKRITNGNTHKYDDIWNWIDNQYQLLKNRSRLEKLYWLFNDLTDFPECECCHKKLNQPGNFINLQDGYRRFCSRSCSALIMQADPKVQTKIKQTKLARYGDEYFNNHDKCVKTKLERYGDEHYNNSEQTKLTCLDRYGCVTPLHNADIEKQVKNTFIEKYGNSCIFKTEHFKTKRIETCQAHFGTDFPMQSDIVKRKSIQTSLEKYGIDHPMKSVAVQEKAKATNIQKYGYVSPMCSKAIQEKARLTNNQKRGVDWPAQDRDIFLKQKQHYSYDNCNFDSRPEIAYYIWLTDNNIKFEYQPNAEFKYEFDGKTHLYFPDFKIYDKDNKFHYVELKGDHFLAENGTWKNPFRDQKWSDEDYAKECAKYEAKHQCCIANSVIVMYNADYQKYLDYVSGKYGEKYLDGFRKDQNMK